MSASLLLEITAKASIVLLLALGVSRLMATRSSAAARHLMWTLAFATLLWLPALVWFAIPLEKNFQRDSKPRNS
mgnify:CR=1 FL=1